MPLDDLRRQRILLPERCWGEKPRISRRNRIWALATFTLGILAAGMIWYGGGGLMTFAAVGIFLMDLLLILHVTFLSVDAQVARLEGLGIGGEVEGM